jgi:hypothetical protein
VPADPAAADPAPAGFFVRTVDSMGTQVGEILAAEPGATRVVVPGLENGTPYRFQVAPADGGVPEFSELSDAVVPGATEEERRTFNQDAPPLEAGTDQLPAAGAAPFGGVFGTAPVITLAALAHYLSTSPGTAALALTTGGLLAACAFLAYKLYRFRASARKAATKEPTKA